MIKKCLFLLPITIILINCSSELPLSTTPVSLSEKELPMCKDVTCPEISIQYFTVEETSEMGHRINASITRLITDALHIGDETNPTTATTVREAAEQFIRTYRTHSAEFPDMPMEYFAEVEVLEGYKSTTFLSVELQHYLFTGGAHGYGGTRFINFDLETGEEVQSKDLFIDRESFEKFAESKFRSVHKIPANESINATGFWFENEQFHLPETIGFSKTQLILIYNQYEIASYADGMIELAIELEEVQPYLAVKLQ